MYDSIKCSSPDWYPRNITVLLCLAGRRGMLAILAASRARTVPYSAYEVAHAAVIIIIKLLFF